MVVMFFFFKKRRKSPNYKISKINRLRFILMILSKAGHFTRRGPYSISIKRQE